MYIFKDLIQTPFIPLYLLSQFFTRLLISIYAFADDQIDLQNMPGVFVSGFLNDVVSSIYITPIILFISIIYRQIASKFRINSKIAGIIGYFIILLFLILNMISELSFWDEFSTRYNFIAVDYLIYTNEIIGTIKESMPFLEILLGILFITIIICNFSWRKFVKEINNKTKIQLIALSSLLTFLLFQFYNPEKIIFSSNIYAQELSRNGPYEFVSAFRNNSLDYFKFYPTLEETKALEIVKSLIAPDNQRFIDNFIDREVSSNKPIKKHNVVFIVIESMSAEYMQSFGNDKNITPNLDKIAHESIFFKNIYATGTRTVRGLEALTLGLPPTPGSSIIRRPNNHNLFNIGSVFKKHGYKNRFIFGGYSYFDNLENYFSNNDYEITDRSNLSEKEISFANIWGVADEDILLKSLEGMDESYQSSTPFFSLIMTTSNHRPYTFPENRIDLPSGGGRSAAVKYTDYAIGKFIEEAKKKPWFKNTIFVITADHCASSAGKTNLPIDKYHIPLMIYAPSILKPQIVTNIASQIDILPTILGLLNFNYESKFMGTDILNFPANRAFIGTYQLLGYIKNNVLVILSPKSKPETYILSNGIQTLSNKVPSSLVDEAISFYQIAYSLFFQGKMLK